MNFKVTEFEGKYYYTTDNGKRYGEGYEFKPAHVSGRL